MLADQGRACSSTIGKSASRWGFHSDCTTLHGSDSICTVVPVIVFQVNTSISTVFPPYQACLCKRGPIYPVLSTVPPSCRAGSARPALPPPGNQLCRESWARTGQVAGPAGGCRAVCCHLCWRNTSVCSSPDKVWGQHEGLPGGPPPPGVGAGQQHMLSSDLLCQVPPHLVWQGRHDHCDP